ncbi:MAG: pantetheine-phosphate adenylyltransferase [Bacteroidetes bacterium]|jgi:pantetheine-phosphate adenylyltransferase|nr:pantetheine-phosphate adenylyltransferase [Bacteroidota bacterium]MDA0879428.1 pantetheine-phosphate adenylyltransferase [Bacteroidota bacterium]MDA1115411.1 pantetheine-phosphate adenylyltransferase [Bacteroidota bacterium]MDP4666105.1 pantetheine-phosphate adenylyltransferase [Flavobacteriaceae bacterium]
MIKAVFPGSFDPITLGHVDVIERGLQLFDEIIIAVGENSSKTNLFSLDQRKEFISEAFKDHPKVSVISYQGMTVDLCQKLKVDFILRGLRNSADFEFEKSIAQINRDMAPIETVFLLTAAETAHISSSIVREIIKNKGAFQKFVPVSVKVNPT